MTAAILDTIVSAETPEGILLELRPAGLSVRFCAFFIDGAMRMAVIYALSMPLGFMGGMGIGLLLICFFALEWFYPVVFELGRSERRPASGCSGLKVVMDNGLPITPAASFTRNLLRVADFLPFCSVSQSSAC